MPPEEIKAWVRDEADTARAALRVELRRMVDETRSALGLPSRQRETYDSIQLGYVRLGEAAREAGMSLALVGHAMGLSRLREVEDTVARHAAEMRKIYPDLVL